MRILTSRALAAAAAAAIGLSAGGLQTASAHGLPDYNYPAPVHYNGDAAAAAAMLAVFGTVAAIIASNHHRKHYRVYNGPHYGPSGSHWARWRHHRHW
jgi:hypothetical protein